MILAAIEHGPLTIFLLVFAGLSVAIILALPASHWVSQKMANVLSFFSLEKLRRPPPLLSRGDALAMQGRVGDAFHVFRQYLKRHPRDLELYLRLIDLAYGPMQDAGLGDAIIAYGLKRLDRRGKRIMKQRRNAIVLGDLYPLKHLGWRDRTEYVHPKVEIPKRQKGQFAPEES